MRHVHTQPPYSRAIRICEETLPYSATSASLGPTELTVCESVSDCLVVADTKGEIVFANTEMERLFGFPPYNVVGEPMESLFAERSRIAYTSQLQRFVKSNPQSPKWFELLGSHKEGRLFPVETRLGLLRKAQGTFIVNILRDMTERQNLREQLRQSQKLEPLALLAGAVAHDFNNLLTIINGCSAILVKDLRLDEVGKGLLQDVIGAGERAAHLTRRLLAFHRKNASLPMILSMNVVIGDIAGLLCRLLGKNITVSTVLHPQTGCVRTDLCQLEQIILNLAVNARDAMPRGGQLTLETANVDADGTDEGMRQANVRPGHYVMLAVTDTGCGMDEQTKAQIFEPFFTTKEPEKGTGLGLSTVAGIVKENGGHIMVTSHVDRGTTFTLLLPRVEVPSPSNGDRCECKDVCP